MIARVGGGGTRSAVVNGLGTVGVVVLLHPVRERVAMPSIAIEIRQFMFSAKSRVGFGVYKRPEASKPWFSGP